MTSTEVYIRARKTQNADRGGVKFYCVLSIEVMTFRMSGSGWVLVEWNIVGIDVLWVLCLGGYGCFFREHCWLRDILLVVVFRDRGSWTPSKAALGIIVEPVGDRWARNSCRRFVLFTGLSVQQNIASKYF